MILYQPEQKYLFWLNGIGISLYSAYILQMEVSAGADFEGGQGGMPPQNVEKNTK